MTEANPGLGTRLSPPKTQLAADPVPPDVAYQLIRDELLLDGSARLNLATFVTTWMEPQARTLMNDCVDKNMIDKDEYPQTAGWGFHPGGDERGEVQPGAAVEE